MPFVVVLLFGIVGGGIISTVTEFTVYRTLRTRRVALINIVIATLGMSLLFQKLARLIWGCRISMLIGVTVSIVSGLIGITIGVLGGFLGGRVDDAVLFAITTRLSIPVVLVALAVVGLLGSSMSLLVITLGLLLWDRFAVVARSTTMQVRNLDFVAAAWCAGCSRFRILTREVLPNIASHLVVVATLEIALAILLEAALSFLGLGVPPPLPSWGLMIAEAKDYMFFSPCVIVIPGVALFMLVTCRSVEMESGLKPCLIMGTARDHLKLPPPVPVSKMTPRARPSIMPFCGPLVTGSCSWRRPEYIWV